MLVSVIIPTYRHRDYVLATLDSVFAQTYTDYEVIVVNDGSPDDTSAVLKPLVDAGRIRYFEQPNAGQGSARNRGLAEAKGEFIAFLDDDDLWPRDKLEWQVEALLSSGTSVVTYGYAAPFTYRPDDVVVNAKNLPSGDILNDFLVWNPIHSPGQTLIRRTALEGIGGLDVSLKGTDDWDLYIRLAQQGLFIYQKRCALKYRWSGQNASANVWRMYQNCMRVRRKHLGFLPVPGMVRLWLRSGRWIRVGHAYSMRRQAQDRLKKGEALIALKLLLQAAFIRPAMFRRREVSKEFFQVCRALIFGGVKLPSRGRGMTVKEIT